MTNALAKAWRDPVGSKLIATAIIGLIGAALSTWLRWWPAIWRGVSSLFGWLLADSPVPHWLALLGVAAIGTVLLATILPLVKGTQAPEPNAYDYTADRFFGVDWTWRWVGDLRDIRDECALCPECKYQLDIRHANYALPTPKTEFHCGSCGRVLAQEEGSPTDVRNKLVKLIHQKLRNGKWVHANSPQT